MRKFEIVKQYKDEKIPLPQRATSKSAGYDLASTEKITIKPGEIKLVPTGLKVLMPKDEVLLIFPRSSLAIKKGLMMSNGVGVIDADYYYAQNDGHISIPLYNIKNEEVVIEKGERIAQGIFTKYFKVNNDQPLTKTRNGGFGSTGK